MKLVIVFGPPAVGKMTVGFELAKLTGLKLFHNHMAIDLVTCFFDWGTPQFALVEEIRRRIFEEVAASNLPGLIFTFVWDVGSADDLSYVRGLAGIFKKQNAGVYYVELEADLETRLQRNKTEFRLSQKPGKRDVERSEKQLLRDEREHKMNSDGHFLDGKRYLKIQNTNISAAEAALQICEHFGFEQIHDQPTGPGDGAPRRP